MIKILLSPQDVQTVLKALQAMPLGESLQAFMRIQQQLAEAQQAQQGAQPGGVTSGVTPPAGPIVPPTPNGADTSKD